MSKSIFFERHNYRKPWLIAILIMLNGFLFYLLIDSIDHISDDFFLAWVFLSIALFSLFFISLEIKTKIDETGIHVKFSPFHWSYRKYLWKDIEKCYVRASSPLREFGGWGWRYSLAGYGKAYSLYGFEGLQIDFKNGRKLFIGSRRAKEMEQTLNQYFNKPNKHE